MKFFVFCTLLNFDKDLFVTLKDRYEAAQDPLKHNKDKIQIHPLNTQQNLV